MSETPDLSTLPQRMRYAATVIKEANVLRAQEPHEHKGFGEFQWDSFGLSRYADGWEARERRKAESDALVIELAKDIGRFDSEPHLGFSTETYIARQLIATGWRKSETA